jgi:molybdopterin converting factor small subunit
MSQKNLNLSEAAMDILNGNRKDKDTKQDSFGQGQKLHDTANKTTACDTGNADWEKPYVEAPTATPPGQTPPVGQEPAKHLPPQPADTVSKANTKVNLHPKKGVNEEGEPDDEEDEVNEDIAALMAGENLSESFKRKASAIFEAAVKSKVGELAEELEAHYVAQFEEAYEDMKEDFTNKVDEYLDYVTESWMEENKLAVESGLRTEIAEGFIESLKTVFEEHYIDIPEEKFDVVEELASKVEALEKQVNEEMNKNINLKQKLSEQKKVEALHAVCEGLTLSQAEKIKTIAESVEFVSEDDFVTQMEDIKESYFSASTVKPASIESLNDVIDLNEEVKPAKRVDPTIAAYASRISQTILK